jgi:DNA-binding CsgD family transcriptional regulator
MLAAAEAGAIDEFQRSQVDLLRARVAFSSFVGGDVPRLLLTAAKRVERFDVELARETYLMAWGAAIIAGSLAAAQVMREVCRGARSLPRPSDAGRPLDLLLDGLTLLVTEGHAAATPTLQRAAKALADMPVEDIVQWGWVAPSASAAVWDIDGLRAIAARQVERTREAGALNALLASISLLPMVTAWMGDFADTAALITEAESVASALGSRMAPSGVLRLLALQGRERDALPVIAAAAEEAVGGRQTAAMAQWASAVLYNGLGRYEEAAGAAEQATSDPLHWWSMWALPELVEAAANAGKAELAHDALRRLAQTTQPSGTDVALGVEARSRALLSDGESAEGLYREAIDRLRGTRVRTELARSHLLYGEWLRRENRRLDAREPLRTAYDLLTGIGMEAFAARARNELLATGDTVPPSMVKTHDDLTPQERHIALLARDGFTNAEIGARLFLSPRTVEWHLGNVFNKLGIRSRRELPSALHDFDAQPIRD